MTDNQEQLEIRAYFALQGLSGAAGTKGDWRNDVTAALRSEAPLSSYFREALASAIDGSISNLEHNFRLELVADKKEKKRRQDWFGGEIDRRYWIEIGRWMTARISEGTTRTKAKEDAAAKKFNTSEATCDKAKIYYDRVMRWVNSSKDGDRWKVFEGIGLCPEDALINWFISRDSLGNPPDTA